MRAAATRKVIEQHTYGPCRRTARGPIAQIELVVQDHPGSERCLKAAERNPLVSAMIALADERGRTPSNAVAPSLTYCGRSSAVFGTGDRTPLALGGAIYIVLAMVAVAQFTGVPESDASAARIAAFFTESRSGLLIAAGAMGVGVAFFVWFLTVLHALLRRAAGPDSALPTLLLVSGSAFTLTMAIGYAAAATGAYQLAREPGSELVLRMLWDLWNNVLVFGRLFLVVGFLAVGATVLRTAALPSWIGWLSVAMAPLSLMIGAHLFVQAGPFSPTGAFSFVWFAPFAVWSVGISVVLARTAASAGQQKVVGRNAAGAHA